MNLLTDQWIPVQHQHQFKHINLETLLTQQEELSISLPRDDMELACLQLLICLTQVLFPPKDSKELGKRITTTLTHEDYQAAIADKIEWFELDHPIQPFMQTRGVKATESTDMAKLFAGLDSKSSCCFVNEPNLATFLCPSCTTIGLFNQANNAPSFGGGNHGGFKPGLRGSSPITTLILSEQSNNLRATVWNNVLPEDTLTKLLPCYLDKKQQAPVWVELIKVGTKVSSADTGLLRGLFWQPAHIELIKGDYRQCSCCGVEAQCYNGFNKEQFGYVFLGTFPHPHSPRSFDIKKGEKVEKFASFTTTAPAWTQLRQFLFAQETEKQGQTPAAVVSQAEQLKHGKLFLLVGGYRNNQAAILERHHDLFNIAQGWQENYDLIERIIEKGLSYKSALKTSFYVLKKELFKKSSFKKDSKKLPDKIYDLAETQFYKQTESLIHDSLKQLTFKEKKAHFEILDKELSLVCRTIFNQLTEPYQENPAVIKALTIARRSLEKAFTELKNTNGDKK